MASLREEIWDEVLPEVQEFRLNAGADGENVSAACHDLASVAVRAREAAVLNSEGRMLVDEDLEWMWDQLSALQRETLALFASGASYTKIAEVRGKSPITVRNTLSRIQDKLGISTKRDLVIWAVRNGLLDDVVVGR